MISRKIRMQGVSQKGIEYRRLLSFIVLSDRCFLQNRIED